MLARESAPDAGPQPTIAAAILMPQDRITREPLGAWAERLLGELDETLRGTRRTRAVAGQLGFVGNNAGLIAAHRGDMEAAYRITERQLWWQGRLARRSGDAAVTAYGVQPWVNLGRLEALTGRWREALARFSSLGTYAVAGTLQLGCVRLSGPAWTALMNSREQFVRYLETVYVTDTLKAMLLNRQFDLVPPFAARVAEGGLRWICEEARVVAECRAGNARAAAVRARDAAREAEGWPRAVLRMRAAEAYACAGEVDLAAGILSPIARVVRQVSPEQMANPHLMPATARLAGACREVGLDDDAGALARRVLEGARAARDELMEIEMLRLLVEASPEGERETWETALHELEQSTEYARYRRGASPPLNPVVTALYERMEAAFSS